MRLTGGRLGMGLVMPTALADRVFAPYAVYREEAARAGRAIPIVQLKTAG